MTEIDLNNIVFAGVFCALAGVCVAKQALVSNDFTNVMMLFLGSVLSTFMACMWLGQSGIMGEKI